MIIEVKQHIPSFFEGYEPKVYYIECGVETDGIVQKLKDHKGVPFASFLSREVGFIQRWQEKEKFDYWRITYCTSRQPLLVAHMKNGKYWVVAYLNKRKKNGQPFTENDT